MDRTGILRQIEIIFEEVLDENDINLTEATTANDVEGWDSLTHIQLIVAIEKHFNVKFTSKEILSWKNIGEMVDSICSKLN